VHSKDFYNTVLHTIFKIFYSKPALLNDFRMKLKSVHSLLSITGKDVHQPTVTGVVFTGHRHSKRERERGERGRGEKGKKRKGKRGERGRGRKREKKKGKKDPVYW
jgi:hypothetical protein